MFKIILKNELKNTFKNGGIFSQNILFFVISCAIFLIISQNQNTQILNVIIFCLVFSLIFVNSTFLQQDFQDGTIEQNLILFQDFELYILAKIIANWIIYALPIIISSALIIFLVSIDFQILKAVTLLTFASFSINSICAFCATLTLGSQRKSIIAIFILPLILPILLITISGIYGDNFIKSLEILTALVVFFTTILTFLSVKIVKITAG